MALIVYGPPVDGVVTFTLALDNRRFIVIVIALLPADTLAVVVPHRKSPSSSLAGDNETVSEALCVSGDILL
jgi:hypothetical protein